MKPDRSSTDDFYLNSLLKVFSFCQKFDKVCLCPRGSQMHSNCCPQCAEISFRKQLHFRNLNQDCWDTGPVVIGNPDKFIECLRLSHLVLYLLFSLNQVSAKSRYIFLLLLIDYSNSIGTLRCSYWLRQRLSFPSIVCDFGRHEGIVVGWVSPCLGLYFFFNFLRWYF